MKLIDIKCVNRLKLFVINDEINWLNDGAALCHSMHIKAHPHIDNAGIQHLNLRFNSMRQITNYMSNSGTHIKNKLWHHHMKAIFHFILTEKLISKSTDAIYLDAIAASLYSSVFSFLLQSYTLAYTIRCNPKKIMWNCEKMIFTKSHGKKQPC